MASPFGPHYVSHVLGDGEHVFKEKLKNLSSSVQVPPSCLGWKWLFHSPLLVSCPIDRWNCFRRNRQIVIFWNSLLRTQVSQWIPLWIHCGRYEGYWSNGKFQKSLIDEEMTDAAQLQTSLRPKGVDHLDIFNSNSRWLLCSWPKQASLWISKQITPTLFFKKERSA